MCINEVFFTDACAHARRHIDTQTHTYLSHVSVGCESRSGTIEGKGEVYRRGKTRKGVAICDVEAEGPFVSEREEAKELGEGWRMEGEMLGNNLFVYCERVSLGLV